jgi:hypothetical protein
MKFHGRFFLCDAGLTFARLAYVSTSWIAYVSSCWSGKKAQPRCRYS